MYLSRFERLGPLPRWQTEMVKVIPQEVLLQEVGAKKNSSINCVNIKEKYNEISYLNKSITNTYYVIIIAYKLIITHP